MKRGFMFLNAALAWTAVALFRRVEPVLLERLLPAWTVRLTSRSASLGCVTGRLPGRVAPHDAEQRYMEAQGRRRGAAPDRGRAV